MTRLLAAGLTLILLGCGAAEAAPCKTTDEAYQRLVWLEHEAMQQYLDKKIHEAPFADLFHHQLPLLSASVNTDAPAKACQAIDATATKYGVALGWVGQDGQATSDAGNKQTPPDAASSG